jgi:hypothetical protein
VFPKNSKKIFQDEKTLTFIFVSNNQTTNHFGVEKETKQGINRWHTEIFPNYMMSPPRKPYDS